MQECKDVVEVEGFGDSVVVAAVGEFFPCFLFGFADGVEVCHVLGAGQGMVVLAWRILEGVKAWKDAEAGRAPCIGKGEGIVF
jgi:hypothetical protein